MREKSSKWFPGKAKIVDESTEVALKEISTDSHRTATRSGSLFINAVHNKDASFAQEDPESGDIICRPGSISQQLLLPNVEDNSAQLKTPSDNPKRRL